MLTVAIVVAAAASLAQLLSGDIHGREVVHSPRSWPRWRGISTGTKGAPLHIFGIPDTREPA